MHVLKSKINATIRNEGDMIGWESDEETVGPAALAAKQSLLKAIPYLLPPDTPDGSLYRLVLEHGDFGIHNTTITGQLNGDPLVTSLFDWERACFWPALLSDPLVAVSPVDLVADVNARPAVTRLPEEPTQDDLVMYRTWARHYIKVPKCCVLSLSLIHGGVARRTNKCHRGCTTRPLATKLPSERGKTSDTCGLLCGTGEGVIRRSSLAAWERRPRSGCRNLGLRKERAPQDSPSDAEGPRLSTRQSPV
jgi:hypothetical protein